MAAVLEELKINYRDAGDELVAKCPNPKHEDNHPSWSINKVSGAHNCFSCGFKGDLVSLVAALHPKFGMWEALRFLRDLGIPERVITSYEFQPYDRMPQPEPLIEEAKLWQFTTPPYRAIMNRNLTMLAVQLYGVLWDNKRRAWVFPVRNHKGELLGWQIKSKHYFYNYPKGRWKRGTLFGIDKLSVRSVILVESPLDVCRLWSEGIMGGLSSLGVEVSDQQMRLIMEVAEELTLALDNDAAGQRITQKIVDEWATRIPIKLFNYGEAEGKDIGELSRSEILRGIREAKSGIRGVLRVSEAVVRDGGGRRVLRRPRRLQSDPSEGVGGGEEGR